MYQSFHRLFRKNYHKTTCSVLQFKHLDIHIWIFSHIQDAWFVEFSVLSFSYIQIHFSYFGIHTNVPSHICISHNQGVPVLEITSFSFTSFVIPSRKFPVLSFPVSCRYQLSLLQYYNYSAVGDVISVFLASAQSAKKYSTKICYVISC